MLLLRLDRLRVFVGRNDGVLVVAVNGWEAVESSDARRRRGKEIVRLRGLWGLHGQHDVFGWQLDGHWVRGRGVDIASWSRGKRPVPLRFGRVFGNSGILGSLPSDLCSVDASELSGGIQVHTLNFIPCEVSAGVGADVGKTIPLVHAEFSDADFDIETVVIFLVDSALGQVLPEHVLVSVFATLDLRNQASPSLRKISHTAADEAFPPEVLLVGSSIGPLSRADADEHADFSSGPFAADSLVQNLGGGVVFSGAFVDKDRVADLDGLEGKTGGGGCTAGLPDGAFEFRSGFRAGVVRPQQLGFATLGGSLVDSGDSTARRSADARQNYESLYTYVLVRFSLLS